MLNSKIATALILAAGLASTDAALAQAADTAETADTAIFGSWRNLHSASGADPVLEDLAFAVLPRAVERGTRFMVLDREGRQAVCCLVVDSARLDAIALETRYRLPGVWIADLLGNEETNRRQGEPYVFAMKRDGALVSHEFSTGAGAYSDLGGLLLPAGSTLDAAGGTVQRGADSWRIAFQSRRLADENGAVDRYTLQPEAAGAKPETVEVSYSTY